MPIRSLVRFFSAARARLLPSYDEPGHDPTARSRASASSRTSSVASGRYQSRTVAQMASPLLGPVEQGQVDPAADDAVLEVVHRVGDVVGEVHHLRLDAATRLRRRPWRIQREDRAGRRRRPRTWHGRPSVEPVATGTSCTRRAWPGSGSARPTDRRRRPTWPPAGSGCAASGRCPRSRRSRPRARRAPPRRCGRTAGARGRAPAPRSRRGRGGSRAGGRGRGRPARPRGCG